MSDRAIPFLFRLHFAWQVLRGRPLTPPSPSYWFEIQGFADVDVSELGGGRSRVLSADGFRVRRGAVQAGQEKSA